MNRFPCLWCLGARTGVSTSRRLKEVGELSWCDFSSGSLPASSSWPFWLQVPINILFRWAFWVWGVKSITNSSTEIFLRVSWYCIYSWVNSVFLKLSSKYPNLSVPSAACWNPDWYITLYNLQSPVFPKHTWQWLPSLYFSLFIHQEKLLN